jgi:hypothetical protein
VDQDLRIPRPEVSMGAENGAFEQDLPEADYEVDHGLTDIDIMMAQEFQEIETRDNEAFSPL